MTEFKTGRRDRLAGKKFGKNSKKTRKSALDLAFKKPNAQETSQYVPVETQKTQQSAKRLQMEFSDKKNTLANLSGTRDLIDIADLCQLL